jgi:hypothetical protein
LTTSLKKVNLSFGDKEFTAIEKSINELANYEGVQIITESINTFRIAEKEALENKRLELTALLKRADSGFEKKIEKAMVAFITSKIKKLDKKNGVVVITKIIDVLKYDEEQKLIKYKFKIL